MKKRLLVLLLAVALVVSCLSVGAAADNQKAMWIFKEHVYVTNNADGHAYQASYPYRRPFDVVAYSSNTTALAPFDAKVVAIDSDNGHVVLIESTAPVELANGNTSYVSVAFAHDNDISDLYVGKTLKQGEGFYTQGTYGQASGAHIHIEVALGKYSDVGGGILSFVRAQSRATDPDEVFYLYENTSITKSGGYNWKYASSTVTKPDAPAASVVAVNYAAETITYDGKYEVSGDSNFGSIISSGSKVNPGSMLYVRVKASGNVPASDATSLFLSTRPMLMDRISFDYATETFNSNNSFQYSFDDSSWQSCPGKLSLADVKGHDKVYFRLAATDSSFASDSYDVAVPTRSAAPSAHVVTIDYANETISFDSAYEVNTAADFSGSAIVSGGAIQPGGSVYVRTKATDSALASASALVSIPARPAAPEVTAVDETIDGKADGKITGVSTAMEYRPASGSWTACEGESVTGLADGTYNVRNKSTENSFAGEAATVTVGKGVPATYTLGLEIAEIETEIYNYAQPEGSALVLTSSGNSKAEIVSAVVDNTDAFEIVGSGQYVEAGGSLSSYIVRPRTGLEAGDYAATVTVTYKGGESYSGDETFTVEADVAFTVEKAPQAAPKAPELGKSELNSITLKALPVNANGAQPQYRIDGGEWQSSPVFENLKSGTSYTFEQRYAAVGSYLASEPSAAVKFSTSSIVIQDTHDIVIAGSAHGSVTSSLSNSSKGGKIVLTVMPEAGYSLGSLRVKAENGESVAVSKEKDGSYSFVMPDADVTVYAEFTDGSVTIPFLDVPTTAWYYDAVSYVYAEGMMTGVSDTAFGPDTTMTRAMFWTVLARIDGGNVDGGSPWYAKAQNWAMSSGVSDGSDPDGIVTREMFVTMLWRYAGSPAASGSLAAFPDAAKVSSWASEAMRWAVANGVIAGVDGSLSPDTGITRAQAATIFMRYAQL